MELGKMVIGKVVQLSSVMKAVRVNVQRMAFDPYTIIYYNKDKELWASDLNVKSQVGDIVLIKPVEKQTQHQVHHFVHDVLFKCGKFVDPVTGRICRATEYRDNSNRKLDPINFN